MRALGIGSVAIRAAAIAAVAGVAFAAAGPGPAAAAAKKLTYGSFLPATHLVHRQGLEPFFERVKADSGGTLAFELFVGGAMGGAKESLKSVRDGVVDSSLVVDLWIKADLPVSATISSLNLLTDDPLVWSAALSDFQFTGCPACEKERAKHRMKGLAFYSTDVYALMCTRPVATLADLQGLKIRATARTGVMSQALGATPVAVTTAEMYEALQRGQADCTVGTPAWLNAYKLKDVVKSIVDVPMGAYFGALVYDMNQDVWDGLSDAQRSAILKNLPKLSADINYAYAEEATSAIAAAKAKGAVVSKPDAAFTDKLAEFLKGEYQAAADVGTAGGLKDPTALLDGFLAKVEKWRKIVADTGRDKARYEEALRREVYSKMK